MYTVVVADDEEELRHALIRKVDWERAGFQVVGDAENGVEALELVAKLEPDLLLTDIQMPFISGIELARQVREIRPTMHIAFLSGFDDFIYAQQAIQYNIISYLLKPISAAELTEELIHIKEKIDNRFREFSQQNTYHTEINSFVIPLILDGVGSSVMSANKEELLGQAISCGLIENHVNAFHYVVMITSIYDADGNNVTTPSYINSINLILKKYARHASFYSCGRVISLLIATSGDFEKYLHILVNDLTQSMERIMKQSCIIGVSREVTGLYQCHEAYKNAINAMSYSHSMELGIHYISDEEPSVTFNPNKVQEIIKKIESLIRGGTLEELESYLDSILVEQGKLAAPDIQTNYLYIELLSAVCRILYSVTEEKELQMKQLFPVLGMNFFEGSMDDKKEKIINFCMEARDIISEQRKKSSKIFCDKALDIIHRDYGNQSLSLVSVSNEINVSSNYLSALIKKYTGETFIDLLTKKRIEAAKELLLCTSMKIREVSEKCGYNDQHYFSYCFKKYMGSSPNALRRQNSQTEQGEKG